MKIVILCLLIARTCLGEQYNLTIQEFEEKFNITYGSAEEEAAAAINLAAHVAKINAQNEKYDNGDANYGEAVYAWDDLSEEEFKKQKTKTEIRGRNYSNRFIQRKNLLRVLILQDRKVQKKYKNGSGGFPKYSHKLRWLNSHSTS